MKKLLNIVLVISVPLVMYSCYYDEFPEEIVEEIPEGKIISFEQEIIPIFVAYNCVECHPSIRQPDFRPGNEYTSLVPAFVTPENPADSRLYEMLNDNNHRGLTTNELNLIKTWIEQGADNN
jgi:hypothetical protein